jgi:hypothetical protein
MKIANSLWLSLTRFANRRTKNNRVLRRAGILTYSTVVRANRFLPPPRVLLNGPPKSGTHLLSDCVALMPEMMFSGRHFALSDFAASPEYRCSLGIHHPRTNVTLDQRSLRRFLKRCPQGMFVTAHAGYDPAFASILEELRFRHIVLIRDPRDIVVSHTFYVKREPLHHHHRFFTETLKSDEVRIMASIRGSEQDTVGASLPSIKEMFAGIMRWLDDPSTLVIRFEDLVGPRGGGSEEKQLATIRTVGAFVDRILTQEQAKQIAWRMYGRGSLTFRQGQTGDWRNHFVEEHRSTFKVVAGDTLVRLGYERDLDW